MSTSRTVTVILSVTLAVILAVILIHCLLYSYIDGISNIGHYYCIQSMVSMYFISCPMCMLVYKPAILFSVSSRSRRPIRSGSTPLLSESVKTPTYRGL